MTKKDASLLPDGVGNDRFILEFLFKGVAKNVGGYALRKRIVKAIEET